MTIVRVEDKRRLSQLVDQHLRGGAELRPFPSAVTQLLAACQESSSTAQTFEKIIECDPGLSIRLLKMANSPLYGLTHEVRSIAHATAILGTRQLRSLALSVAGRSVFTGDEAASKSRKALWSHSLASATVARCLAKQDSDLDGDDAFLSGVFHDVGKLFLYDVVLEEHQSLESEFTGSALASEEEALFGIDHQAVGLKAAHRWGLPEQIKAAIGYHHDPSASLVHPKNAMLMHQANRLAKHWGVGSEEIPDDTILSEVAESFSIEIDQLAALRDPAVDMFEQLLD